MDLNKFATGSCRSVLVPKRAAFARMPDGPAPLRTTSSVQISTSWPSLVQRKRPKQPCRPGPGQPCRRPSRPRWPWSGRCWTSSHRRQRRFVRPRKSEPSPGSRCTLAAGPRPMPSGLQRVLRRPAPMPGRQERAQVQRREPEQQRALLPSWSKQSERQQQPPEREVSSCAQSPLKSRPVLSDAQSAPVRQCGPLHCLDQLKRLRPPPRPTRFPTALS
jgi:hypothetical protein